MHLPTDQLLVAEHLHPGPALRAHLANSDLQGSPVPLLHQLGRDNPAFLKATSKQPFSKLQANSLSQGYKQTAFLKATSNSLSQGYKQNSLSQDYEQTTFSRAIKSLAKIIPYKLFTYTLYSYTFYSY